MYSVILSHRSFFIEFDGVGDKILFKPYKEKNGDGVIIAYNDPAGVKIYTNKNGKKRIDSPAILRKYAGEGVLVYKEKLRPHINEVFRIKLINRKLEEVKERKSYDIPKITSKSLVVPQMYINRYLNDGLNNLIVSFSLTDISTVNEGYLLAFMVDRPYGKVSQNEYRLHECSAGLIARYLKNTKQFLYMLGKELSNYKYEGIVHDSGVYPNGVMLFKEK